MQPSRRTRWLAVLAGLSTTAVALALRALLTGIRGPRNAAEAASPAGWLSKYAGVTLSATVVYFGARCIAPRLRPATTAGIAAAFCIAVEFLQLTPWPRWLSHRHVLLRLVFGEYFGVGDLPCYVLGVLLGVWLEARISRTALLNGPRE